MRTMTTRSSLPGFARSMESLFADFLGELPRFQLRSPADNAFAVNLWETEEAIHVEAEVPGLDANQIELTVANDTLTIHAEYPPEEEGTRVHRAERARGPVERTLRLPTRIDTEDFDAKLENGVLFVRLAKSQLNRPRKIQVRVEKGEGE